MRPWLQDEDQDQAELIRALAAWRQRVAALEAEKSRYHRLTEACGI